jgi:archaellum component FlaF (FlaF/FlaG flagellin family)
MQLKSTVLFLTIFFQLLFVPSLTDAKSFQENPLTKAILLFDKEKFAEAEPLFKKLLDERPDDFMVNYFYGACRTENGHFSDQDLSYLLKASKEVTPLNIDYYFGVQYHAKGQFEKALAYYKSYKAVVSANDQEKVNLNLKMEQCTNKINTYNWTETVESPDKSEVVVTGTTGVAAVSAEIIAPSANTAEISVPVQNKHENTEVAAESNQEILIENDSFFENETGQNEELEKLTDETQVNEPLQAIPVEEQISFNINSEITYFALSNFKTEEGEIYFKEGNLKQTELENVVKQTENMREKYKSAALRAERDSIGQQILALESRSYELNRAVSQLLLQAKSVEYSYWQNAAPEETEKFIRDINVVAAEMKKTVVKAESVSESSELMVIPVFTENKAPERSAPKAKSSGIVYKIQLGAYSRGIPNNLKAVFSKISVLRKVENYTDEKGVVVYTTGNVTSYDDAIVMQNQIKQEGIKDPIIAAYLNGKRITLEQAKEIEKEK